MLEDIKNVLRISGTAFDFEVQDLIDACKIDLKISGIVDAAIDETDPLIKRAITVYCKANFGWDNQEMEKFQQSYDMIKQHMALSSEYNTVVEVI